MLTVAYCRVSTEEQATEGFSIEGQAEKLRSYAALRELGPVTVLADPGRSGKDMERPGLQRLLEAVDQGHVSNVLLWRLDRLSRNLGDLILLADRFGAAGVSLHSFTEQLDLSSATGRMFYNILGSFAQFYREQLGENVRMGTAQAVRQGRWVNRPKTGYDLIDGELVPNSLAPIVRKIFRLRAEGNSYRDIENATGIKFSTVKSVLDSRIYLGEVLLNGEWFPGKHEALVSPEEFQAARRGHVPGQARSRDLLSGRVTCGLCGKKASVQHTADRRVLYRCHSRGQGCKQSARSASGLLRAALLGMALVGSDEHLRAAIREELARAGRPQAERAGRLAGPRSSLAELSRKRRQLLDLHLDGKITSDFFAEEEAGVTEAIRALTEEGNHAVLRSAESDALAKQFERVAAFLVEIDIDQFWEVADEKERRILVEELLERVAMFPDHLEVTVAGAPRLNVLLSEVGLKESRTVGVGGGT